MHFPLHDPRSPDSNAPKFRLNSAQKRKVMPRPIHARIHPGAVQDNLEVVQQRDPDSRVGAVAKANAYGHGIERIYPALQAADGIALLDSKSE